MGKTVGIVGAGVMGKGIAQRFAQYGHRVVLLDVRKDITQKAQKEILRDLKVRRFSDRTVDVDGIMSKISFTEDYSDLAEADYAVENVPEIENVKMGVYEKLDQFCTAECVFMANTSCIPITRIASWVHRSERVIGVHFMNPAAVKNFAEVIRGTQTSDHVVQDMESLLADMNIHCEIVCDSAGFVSNRLSHLFMNEAAFLVYEGIASAQQIDSIFRNGFGHAMGPLETADLIGIDTVVQSLEILYRDYQDSKFRVCPLLRRMSESGNLGRKSGKGFYTYR